MAWGSTPQLSANGGTMEMSFIHGSFPKQEWHIGELTQAALGTDLKSDRV